MVLGGFRSFHVLVTTSVEINPNGHSRKRTVLLKATFTKPRFTQPSFRHTNSVFLHFRKRPASPAS